MAADGEPLTIAPPQEQATVVITRIVDRGREADYKRWVVRLISEAEAFPNSLGVVMLSPSSGDSGAYRLIHRFADERSLQAWEDSPVLRQLVAEADTFSTSQRQEATGMEAWFAIDDAAGARAPKKWKMALVTFVVVYGVTAVIIPREMAWLRSWSFYVVNIITNLLIATLMTYVIMPIAARVLRRFLY